ncbi:MULTISPECIES: LacI family DNA-binding transcriptional regulator [Chromohalobacter]|uniref:LacI family DNA-binding transcriptional regulator n=1 Tax=Chromohalobacter TaxID=42054 RepID=UPI001FB8F8D2|nr:MULTISPECIES: LacI family DNA-binding transcriptional regulator [Chromohalobacter]MCI0509744.1 LacI family DNA-binding transcriptional regulator [Chromohalobacter sp.]MCI0593293.1 LacI family DNA-binding transcriptional regulator [Chromohalobacter sp.]
MTPSHRRITIKDLAARLDVSTATVSNAFNRPDQLSPALRDRILSEARAVGYTGPDARGRSLRTGRSRIIAVVLAESLTYNLNDAVASEFLAGVAEVVDGHGHTLLLLPARQGARLESASMADGFIVYGLVADPRMLEQFPSQKPLMAVDFDIAGHASVHIDNQFACLNIARHTLRQRPRRPAIINLRLTAEPCNGRIIDQPLYEESQTITRLRLNGFYEALAEHDIDPTTVPMWNIEENTYEVCAPVIAGILDLPDDERPDLLLCMSDRIALTVLTLAEQRGLRIPEDLRITGFDGIAEGQYRAPRLTTVRQDSVAKGRLAASMVLGLVPMKHHCLATQLMIGETSP